MGLPLPEVPLEPREALNRSWKFEDEPLNPTVFRFERLLPITPSMPLLALSPERLE